ncbi:unnamed protein product [Amoebophrya sp. A120]|nr:unnamed protein product [Amoebophrya sp. A120]|eukprot:GSA120T00001698001.1
MKKEKMHASVSEAALKKASFVSGALSEQLTNQRICLQLQPTGTNERCRVVRWVHNEEGSSSSSGAATGGGDGGGLQVVGMRKKPLGMAMNPDLVVDYVSGQDLDKNCREVQAGIFWHNGDAEYHDDQKQKFFHHDLFHASGYKSKRRLSLFSGRNKNHSRRTATRRRDSDPTGDGMNLCFGAPAAGGAAGSPSNPRGSSLGEKMRQPLSPKMLFLKKARSSRSLTGGRAPKRDWGERDPIGEQRRKERIDSGNYDAIKVPISPRKKRGAHEDPELAGQQEHTVGWPLEARVDDETIYPLPTGGVPGAARADRGGSSSSSSKAKQSSSRPRSAPAGAKLHRGPSAGSLRRIAKEEYCAPGRHDSAQQFSAENAGSKGHHQQPLAPPVPPNRDRSASPPPGGGPVTDQKCVEIQARKAAGLSATTIEKYSANSTAKDRPAPATSVYRSRRRFNVASRIHETRQGEHAQSINYDDTGSRN